MLADVCPVLSGYAGMFDALARSLDGEDAPMVTLPDGRQSLEFVSAVYESCRTGMPVSMPLGPDNMLYNGWLP